MDAAKIRQTLATLADNLLADPALKLNQPLALVGIRSRGELIAQRLAAELRSRNTGRWGGAIDLGVLDITMYRDDLAARRAITIPQGTDMNFRLDDRPVVLCDDVLETGRSVRAALDALVDFGRPRIIRLAVLVDRGRREFPITADYTGLTVNAPNPEQKIIVHLQPTDPEDAVYLKEAS
ncbi:MAG TPA: bifunctional pyr operon transcriptional regulator/uracil phosphoribosyltransferase PyrR [Phycisphaerae bacterium]|nr:bifunctional pyr operon transcriptional regulator/uracil phosphoribosyltransferase PyrR [Phycisphaerae bacterium]